jgi:hypothetical protein
MDFLQKEINQAYYGFFKNDSVDAVYLSLADVIDKSKWRNEKASRMQKKRLLDRIHIHRRDIRDIWADENISVNVKRAMIDEIKRRLSEKISAMDFNNATKFSIIQSAEEDNLLFEVVMCSETFINLFSKSAPSSSNARNAICENFGIYAKRGS